jgi:hypothetical protein
MTTKRPARKAAPSRTSRKRTPARRRPAPAPAPVRPGGWFDILTWLVAVPMAGAVITLCTVAVTGADLDHVLTVVGLR